MSEKVAPTASQNAALKHGHVRSAYHSFVVTPYDYLKTIAIALMICDHIGAFVFLDINILRVLGRLCVPIWLFLIGYARSRIIDDRLILGAIAVSAMTYIGFGYIEPLNILWTIIVVRLSLPYVLRLLDHDTGQLIFASIVFIALAPFTRLIFEYGTMAFVFALWGHISRNGFSLYGGRWTGQLYGLCALVCYTIIEVIAFGFSLALVPFLIIGMIFVYCLISLYFVRGRVGWVPFSQKTQKILHWVGHHTLEIYVVHLVILFIISWFFYPCWIKSACIPDLLKDGIDLAAFLP